MRYAKKIEMNAPADQVARAIKNVLLKRDIGETKVQLLERDMKDTLDRTDLDDNTKVLLYQQALQGYLQFDRARKQEPISVNMSNPKGYYDMTEDVTKTNTVTPVNQPYTAAKITEGVPKTYKRKAQLLLEKI